MHVSWSADGLVQQRRRHARIHAAAQAEDDAFLADLRADFLHGLLDVIAHRPVFAAAADAVDEIGIHLAPARRVDDFGMELQAEEFPLAVFNRRVFGILRGRHGLEAARKFRELVAVRIPDLQRLGQSGEQRAGRIFHRERALAVFALETLLDFAAEEVRQDLHAVADAQDRVRRARKCFCPATARSSYKRSTARRTG